MQSQEGGIIPLQICCGREFRILEFRRRELADAKGDPEVQRRFGEGRVVHR